MSGLIDAAGTTTPVSVTWASKNTWRSGSAGATATSLNGNLLKGYLDDGTSTTLPNGATATLSGIPYLTYEAYVYYASDQAGAGENLSNGYRSVGINGTNYTWNGTATVVGTANWTGRNWTDDDTLTEGLHYLKATGQKAGTLAVTPNAGASPTARASIAGIQLKDTYTGTLAYWDVNGTSAGAGGATPSGNWTDPNWSASADGSGATSTWTAGVTAVFAAGTDATDTYSVALGSPQTADAVWLKQGSLTLTGSALTLGTTGLLRADGTSTLTLASDLNATALTTTGAVTLSGLSTVTGTLALSSGTLTLSGDLTSTIAGAGFGGILSGGGTLLKQGSGTLKLTAINTFAGTMTIAAGTLEAGIATTSGDASSLGNGTTTLNVNAGGTLLFSTASRAAGYHRGAVNVRGGTITFNSDDNTLASGNTLTSTPPPA
ncbi:MAG: autotransporter-associated beta strand repeat-containing protein [Luteolibacter sp.]